MRSAKGENEFLDLPPTELALASEGEDESSDSSPIEPLFKNNKLYM